ncbi:MAG: hypothetical protein LAN84_09775 [Acidobacteriia bacterium]|nr:hypothetical protein [Terriglobia bacterium]
MKRTAKSADKRRRFVMRAKFADGEIVVQRGMDTPLEVIRAVVARPGYETDDGRFYAEDELERLQRRPSRKGKASR